MNEEAIISQWNIDEHGNPISVKTEQETQVSVGGNLVQLEGVPDEMQGVTIEDKSGNVFFRVENLDEVYDSDYAYYLMKDGRVKFNPSQNGELLYFKYYSKGVTLLSVSRIYYKDSYDNVVKILEDLIKAGFDALKVLEVFGGAKEVIDRLERDLDNGRALATQLEDVIAEGKPLQENLNADITEAKKWKDSLHKDVAEGKILQPQLHQDVIDGRETDANLTQTINSATELDDKIKTTGNASFIIEVDNWIASDDSDWAYMYSLTTSLNSSDLVFKTQEITTKGFEDCLLYSIVKDSNTIAFYTDDKVRTKVIINARQYGGTIQDFSVVNTDLISEGASNKYVTPQEKVNIGTIPDIKQQCELNKSSLEDNTTQINFIGVIPKRQALEIDDTLALQRAINTNNPVYLVDNLTISDTIQFNFNTKISAKSKDITITMTNDNKYAFEYNSELKSSSYDINSGIMFNQFELIAKYGIKLNQSGDYDTIFLKQGAIKSPIFNIIITGKYGESVDTNYNSSVEPTFSELEGYGIGLKLTKVFDANISSCLFQNNGIGIYLEGSDINKIDISRFHNNARHIHIKSLSTYGYQNKIIDCDILHNRRYGGIYIDDNVKFTQINGNYFENYQLSSCFIKSVNDLGTLISGNRFDDTRQETPFLSVQPRYGMIFTENRYNSNNDLTKFEVLESTSGYDTNHNQRLLFINNSEHIPLPTPLPGVFTKAINPYLFRFNNYNKIDGNNLTPFRYDETLKTYVTNGSMKPYFPIQSTTHRSFKIKVCARRLAESTNTGFIGTVFFPKDDKPITIDSGNKGFTDFVNLQVIEFTVNIPDDKLALGDLRIEWTSAQIEVESIELIPV